MNKYVNKYIVRVNTMIGYAVATFELKQDPCNFPTVKFKPLSLGWTHTQWIEASSSKELEPLMNHIRSLCTKPGDVELIQVCAGEKGKTLLPQDPEGWAVVMDV